MELAKLKAKRVGHRRVIESYLKKIENAKRNSALLEFQAILEAITVKVNFLNSLNEEILEKTEADDIVSEIEESEEYSLTLDINLRHLQAFNDCLVEREKTKTAQQFSKSDVSPACRKAPATESSIQPSKNDQREVPGKTSDTNERDATLISGNNVVIKQSEAISVPAAKDTNEREATSIPGNTAVTQQSKAISVPGSTEDTKERKATSIPGNTAVTQQMETISVPRNIEDKKEREATSIPGNSAATQMKPSKPRIVGKPRVDVIKITWNAPTVLLNPPVSYEVRYRSVSENKWILYKEHLSSNFLKLENLPSGSRFVFQVRMINDDDVGPYSLESDAISTVESAAYRMSSKLKDVQMDKAKIAVKSLPFTEDKTCRNEVAKSRKLTLGDESRCTIKEKTIMILGPTGSGKSTLVDAMINYIFGVSWRDSFRLTVENLEADEMKNKGNQALSQTIWITCYTIHPIEGTRLPYKLTIIDTPGYGDSRGIVADREITEQIRQLFETKDKKGILYLDAVCFVIKASDARLTTTQQYIFNSILSLFQKDIIDNFCMMITFADGSPPEVLSALKAHDLPYKHYFPFNSSSLFADNKSENATNVNRVMVDWNMGRKSFDNFFKALAKLNTKSLALSREVLGERKQIEITVENLQERLNAALEMNDSVEKQKKLMEDIEGEIDKNKEYTYPVTTCTKESSSSSNLNCEKCRSTCHRKCWSLNVNFIIRGCEVFSKGKCTQCDGKCNAYSHVKECFVYHYSTEHVILKYEDIKRPFEAAAKKKLDHEGLLREMQTKADALNGEIQEMIETITKSKRRLQEIALRDDPLSAEEQFDIWIKEEEVNKKEGWLTRVKGLMKLKNDAQRTAGIEKVGRDIQAKIKETAKSANRALLNS